MSEYEFTQDWFHWAPDVWAQLAPLMPDTRHFLEVGSFEGRSAIWIAENMAKPDASIWCIDTWAGGEEHGAEDMGAVEVRFDANIERLKAKKPDIDVVKLKGTSVEQLALRLPYYGKFFDFIYIDGSHIAKDVLTDACMAWPLLRPGGVIVFDDYFWGEPRDILHRPKIAVDSFVNIFAEEIEIIPTGYQYVVRKKAL